MYKIGEARYLEQSMASIIQGLQEAEKLLGYLGRIDIERIREGGREQRNGDFQNTKYLEQYDKNMKRTGEYEQRTRNWQENGRRQERRYENWSRPERMQGFVLRQNRWVENGYRQDRRQETENEQGQRRSDNTHRIYQKQNLCLEKINYSMEKKRNCEEALIKQCAEEEKFKKQCAEKEKLKKQYDEQEKLKKQYAEIEKRKDEIEREVTKRVEDAKRIMEKQLMEDMERRRKK